jgi:hypothetical protein
MSFGEFLTKVAVILTCYSAVQEGLISAPFGWKACGTLVALSFLRDANLRWREAVRLASGFGFWFVVTCLIVCIPNAVLKKLIGLESWGFSYWGSVAAAGVLSMIFRGYVIVCESLSRWAMAAIGFDNRRLDNVHRYYQQQTWEWLFGSPEPQHNDEGWPDDDDEWDDGFAYTDERGVTVVDGEIDCCPDCGDPYTDAPYCQGCAAAFSPNANDHPRRLN